MPDRPFLGPYTTGVTDAGEIYRQWIDWQQAARETSGWIEFAMHNDEQKETINEVTDIVFDESIILKHIKNILSTKKNVITKNKINIMCISCRKKYIREPHEMYNIVDRKGVILCEDCMVRHNYNKCEKCGQFYERECPCNKKKSRKKLDVLEYDRKEIYKPFQVDRNDNILLGLEIEIEFPEGDRSNPRDFSWSTYVKDNLKELSEEDWIYFKRDGSITRGLEIVTYPLGWEWVKANYKKIELFEGLIGKGFSSKATTTCGLHVHIDKSLFKTCHLGKFTLFHYNNLPFICLISERGWTSIQRWANFNKSKSSIMGNIKNKWNSRRHELINFNNPETVELRYFRGALDKFSILKAIQFVVSLYDYTRNISLSESDKISNYIKYLENNKKEYLELYQFLEPVKEKYK